MALHLWLLTGQLVTLQLQTGEKGSGKQHCVVSKFHFVRWKYGHQVERPPTSQLIDAATFLTKPSQWQQLSQSLTGCRLMWGQTLSSRDVSAFQSSVEEETSGSKYSVAVFPPTQSPRQPLTVIMSIWMAREATGQRRTRQQITLIVKWKRHEQRGKIILLDGFDWSSYCLKGYRRQGLGCLRGYVCLCRYGMKRELLQSAAATKGNLHISIQSLGRIRWSCQYSITYTV